MKCMNSLLFERNVDPISNELILGWGREVLIYGKPGQSLTSEADVYYFSPEGKKLVKFFFLYLKTVSHGEHKTARSFKIWTSLDVW